MPPACLCLRLPEERSQGSPKVVTLPHLGASTGEAEENCAVMVADQVRDFLENGNISNSVNYPEAVLPRAPNTTRLAIANSNVPNMVGQISTCLAHARINIADLLNNPAANTPTRSSTPRAQSSEICSVRSAPSKGYCRRGFFW